MRCLYSWLRRSGRSLRSLLALIPLVALLAQGSAALAGTTGSLSGTVSDVGPSGTSPLANAKVTVTSPSQTISTTTDRSGHFTFASLAPDSYTVSVERQGYEPTSQAGITVTADNNQTLSLRTRSALRTIGRVTTRANTDLVRPGTTSDVYSVSGAVAGASATLGGGFSQEQAYSQIASVPGAYVPAGLIGWNQTVFIRGADYDQTGYEYDGVPVNRAFDNYAAHTASTLGQQELQVYTGGGPSGASANGLGGFINQVIRSGTYPGFGTFEVGLGSPTFYHQLKAEVGGATSNRNFSYYLGFTGNNQDYRLFDQFQGRGQAAFSFPLTTPGLNGAGINGPAPACVNGANPNPTPVGVSQSPGCYAFVTTPIEGNPAYVTDREFVTNLHFGIPHKNGTKDDVQLLYTSSQLGTNFGTSVADIGASTFLNAFGALPNFHDSYVYPSGVAFGTKATPGLQPIPYFFPNSNQHAFGAPVERDHRDSFTNGSSILKLQYQKNFGSNAYARLFGYTFYSDWLNTGPNIDGGVPVNSSRDYELSTHTRGLELQLADQINAQNLLQGTFNYTTASVVRFNNQTTRHGLTYPTTNLVDATGNCYGATGDLATCNGAANRGTFQQPVPFAATGAAAAANAQWQVTETGYNGTYNTVKPKFSSFSLQDQFKPFDRLTLNLGVREENFEYDLANSNTPAKNFWFAAAQREFCYNPVTLANGKQSLTCPAGFVHPNGQNGAALFANNSEPVKHNVFEPRLGFTYTIDPDTVLRGSYGRFAQPPNTAAVQYNTAQYNTAAYDFGKFVGVGFFSPRHDIRPSISSNFDLSLEKHLKGTDISFKVSPFARSVIDQQNNVFLDQVTQFVSAINAGNVKAYGVEAQLSKGDFNRNGFAAQISYAFTDEKIRYTNLGNSSVNVIDQINNSIKGYNGFTKTGGGTPCFGTDGTPQAACTGTSIANPYYNQAPQPLLDRNGSYTPFDFTPSVFGAVQDAYFSPHVITGLLNYKHNRLTVTPSVQVSFGTLYGVPTEVLGLDPSSCTANSAGIPTAVAAGRALAPDYTSCQNAFVVPNPETGRFDRMGEFQNPTNLVANLQLAYDVSSKVRARVTVANLVNQCFGGTQAAWANGGPHVCSYGLDGYNATSYYSNFYNGSGPNDVVANTAPVNQYNAHSYRPGTSSNGSVPYTNPINVYFTLDFKL